MQEKRKLMICNTNPEFGYDGPYEADSKEVLADEMQPCISAWADEVEYEGHDKKEIESQIREKFIAGLEYR